MIGLRTLARTAAVVAVTLALVACSDSSSSEGAGSASSDSSATERSDSVPGADSTGGDDSSANATTTSVSGSGSTTRPATTAATASTVPAPGASDPLANAPEPDSTEADDFIGPAAADCVDAAAGTSVAEIVLDDDRILFGDAPATSCLRVHAAQRISVRNSGSVRADVLVGSEILTVEPGASASTEVLSTRYEIADVFDVYVETIDATLIVQVVP